MNKFLGLKFMDDSYDEIDYSVPKSIFGYKRKKPLTLKQLFWFSIISNVVMPILIFYIIARGI